MKISVIGAGYVGLTTAACLAQVGHEVFCAESDAQKLDKLQAGIIPIFEPGLETIVAHAMRDGRLGFGSTEQAIDDGQVIFICVGTPPLANGDADLSAVESLARAIAQRATGYKLIIEKSTVPVQTASQLLRQLTNRSKLGARFDVASNPEFLREGSAVHDFLHPERIVIGVESQRAEKILREVYAPIVEQTFTCPIHERCTVDHAITLLVTDTNSSELIKHASNSFLAMKVSFINMISDLCEAANADIGAVARGIGLDSRIGPEFLNPGVGFGGFCFPKDVQSIVRIAEKFGCNFDLLKEVEKINKDRVGRFVGKIKNELWVLDGKKLGVWGLAFKPNTDDVRFAPALSIIRELLLEGCQIQAYDPQAADRARQELPEVLYCDDPYMAAEGADALLVLTEWHEFQQVDLGRVARTMERPLIIDGRNALALDDAVAHGFEYVGIGGVRSGPRNEVRQKAVFAD
jgi:UDPglucose 6-dehydrogenase